ncbi:glycosyl hydrolase, glucoamylase [Synechococcus sp. PCC 7502]|uniref:glycoside hydrolase family 15 protein n=1 Tax=Synechococcus sp. PCC 7502 TaxID=1173263 RepID=UPI00029F8A4C|nr:glycoside hydrolase family 15 protein [Synechococcus sp. PCC 7502]AFY72565.1 glycosyl hydrolase, glucoamylase [Synechococcus sp. PCC 7502]
MTPKLQARLDSYYQEVSAVILARQNPITGLLPASTAINAHGNYTDAWVRDNVYSILAVWGLALAYRKLDSDRGRTYELEQSVVKLMRGLLFAMMQQAQKVEKFKVTQAPLDALHAKYSTATAATVVGDDQWGHLQLDATSLYVLMLAQMTASGLAIIFTIDEVNFIQNLVYYIGRAYRTPDYGIWERGNKANHGKPELNASSVGMAKAALEAINGLDLFGVRGSQASVIHVLLDEIARTRTTLRSLLPRESSSKEVDGALLSVIGYPAFAVEDQALVDRTRNKVISKLEGKYGCKRFLRDGHQTVIEDAKRLHYEPWELKQFEHLECEWPLFFTYLMLDALFRGDRSEAEAYFQKLQPLLIEKDGYQLLPELFFVPSANIEAERQQPQSQPRLPNANLPLVWAQSLYLLGKLLREDLLAIGDIDPLGRHLQITNYRLPVVQIALLAEDKNLQSELATYGIETQTPNQIAPIQVRQAEDLSKIYYHIGRNDKLQLTGRPIRRLRSLTTSRMFRIRGEAIAFLPSFLDQAQFYLTLDYHFLVSQIKGELVYIQRHWHHRGRPTMTLLLTHRMFETEGKEAAIAQSPFLQLLKELQNGTCNGVTIKLGGLHQLLITAATERIDFIHDFQFSESALTETPPISEYLQTDINASYPLSHTQEFLLESERDVSQLLLRLQASRNLYEQIDLLETLTQLRGQEFDTRLHGEYLAIADLLNEVYAKAGKWRLWTIIRRAAGLMGKTDIGLGDAVTSILIQGKQIAVGKSYSEASLITDPIPSAEVMAKIEEFRSADIRERSLTQEIIIYLSVLIKAEPELCDGLLTLRVGYLILLITSELAQELKVTQDEAYEHLMGLSPFAVKSRLRQVLVGYDNLNQTLFRQESLQVNLQQEIKWVIPTDINLSQTDQLQDQHQDQDQTEQSYWLQQRQRDGGLNRVPKGFYPQVWQVMQHCKGIVIGDKLDRRNRLDSDIILAEMTAGEKNFALRIEHLLNKIQAPEYRQVNTEALIELAAIATQNPDLQIDDYIVLDVLIGHAVRLAWLDQNCNECQNYDLHKGLAWRSFYETSPSVCATYIAKALRFLMELAPKMVTVNS